MSLCQQVTDIVGVTCDRCGHEVADPIIVDGKPLHQGPAHCDQVSSAHDVAAYLEAVVDDHDAVVCVVSFADGRWHFDGITADRQNTRLMQELGESLGAFLLRVQGGLLPLP